MMVTVLDILVESTATPPSYQVSKYNAEYSRLEFSLLLYQIESEGGRKICKFVCINISVQLCSRGSKFWRTSSERLRLFVFALFFNSY